MIIADLSQLVLSNLFESLGTHTNAPLNIEMLRHMVLNSIRAYRMKFHQTYGEMVIAADSENYWRKQVFPYYKANRKKAREESEIDWPFVYASIRQLQKEIDDTFSYPVISVDGCEADDIIAQMVRFNAPNKTLILSSDKDFLQLQKYGGVEQYAIIQKIFLTDTSPERFLRHKLCRGDAGDGVPNILSGDDYLVSGKRQSPVTQKRLALWENYTEAELIEEFGSKYIRNKKMIDLDQTPDNLKEEIITQYEKQLTKNNSGKLMDYFIQNRLRNLMSMVNDF